MKIKFLGSGSVFVLGDENYHSNILISKYNKKNDKIDKLLIDAGTNIAESLNYHKENINDIDAIYITHIHADHTGGLEYIAFKRYFELYPFGQNKPKLIAKNSILKTLWKNVLKGGLSSIEGEENKLETFFDTNYVKKNNSFNFSDTKFELIQTIHTVNNNTILPSYGIKFRENMKNVFISGDTKFNIDQILNCYDYFDLIFQDCEFENYIGGVHAQFHQLCTIPKHLKKKMFLYHYSLNNKTFEELEEKVLKNGFAGLVSRGMEFTI